MFVQIVMEPDLTSPYLSNEAKRLSVGRHPERNDVFFLREGTRYSPELEKSEPLEPVWHSWAAGALMAAFIGIVIVGALMGH